MEKQSKKPRFYVGIDCGTKTGIAIWDSEKKNFVHIKTLAIHKALSFVQNFYQCQFAEGIWVFVENPNTFVPFEGHEKRNRTKEQGAGSIKRDYAIWRDALTDWGVGWRGTSLRGGLKKMKADAFQKMTGYEGKTSEHARDAAMIVFGR